MGADNINNLLDRVGFVEDLDIILAGISKLEGRIAEVSNKSLTVMVDLKGAETLNALLDGTTKAEAAANDLNKVLRDTKVTVEQLSQANTSYGAGMSDSLEKYAQLKGQIMENTDKISEYKKQIKDTKNAIDNFGTSILQNKQVAEQYNSVIDKNNQAIIDLSTQNKLFNEQLKIVGQSISVQSKLQDNNTEAIARNKSAQIELTNTVKDLTGQRAEAEEKAFNKAWDQGVRWQAQQARNAENEKQRQDKAINTAQAREIADVSRAVKRAEAEEKAAQRIAAAQTQVEKIAARFGGQLIRAVGSIIIWQILFEAITKVGEVIMASIPGTNAYVQAQDKLRQANDSLAKSFDGLSDSIQKQIELEKKVELNAMADGETRQAIADNTVEGMKRAEAAIKAFGVTNGAVYDAEMAQLKAANDVRDKELEKLNERLEIIRKIQLLITKSQGENIDVVKDNFSNADLPKSIKNGLSIDLAKGINSGANVNDVLDDLRAKFIGENTDTKENIKQKEEEKQNAITEVQAKHASIAYAKSLELNKQMSDVREQYRQAGEKEDVASVDKIVADTNAKYKLLAAEVNRNRETYRLSMTTKDDVDYVDKNIKAYDNILRVLKAVGEQEKRNQAYELAGQEYGANSAASNAMSAGKADISKFDASYGIPNYNSMARAQDLATKSKKEALNLQFRQMASTITDSKLLEEAQRQQDEKLIQVDKAAYKERLELASQYYSAVTQKIDISTSELSGENSRRHFDKLTSILNGRGTPDAKEYKKFIEDTQSQKADANIQIQGIDKKIPDAQLAYSKSVDASKGPLSSDAKEEADNQVELNKRTLDTLYEQKAEYNSKIAQLNEDLRKKELENEQALKDLTIELVTETVNSLKTIQDNQMAAEQQQLDIKKQQVELASEQKMRAIDAETGFATTKNNEKALSAAQTAAKENELQQKSNELALKKAIADKEAAEAGIIMNTALAISKALPLLSNPVTVSLGVAEIAVITAIGAVQYAAAASTPLPQFADGGVTSTPSFIAGEKGPEIMKTPAGDIMMADKPGVYTAPIGTQIFKNDMTEAIIRHASAGIGLSVYDVQASKSKGMTDERIVESINDLGDTMLDIHRNTSHIIKNNITIYSNNSKQYKH